MSPELAQREGAFPKIWSRSSHAVLFTAVDTSVAVYSWAAPSLGRCPQASSASDLYIV